LLAALAERGHPRAGIEGGARVLLEERVAHVEWRVEPGPLVEVGEVRIEGLDRVDERHVRKALAKLGERGVRTGDRYAPSRLRAAQRAVADLGLFRSVAVRPVQPEGDALAAQDASAHATWPIEVAVQERPRRGIRLGGGYGTEDRFRVRGEWEHRNLFGEGERLEVSGKYSSLVAAGRVRYLDPSFIEPDVEAEIPVAFEHETEPAADVDRAWGAIELRVPVGGGVVARAGYRFERAEVVKRFADLRAFDPAAPLQPDTFLLGSATLGLRRIRVDDLLEPTRGTSFDLELRPTLRALGSDVDYLRWRASAKTYASWRRLVLALRFEIGAIHPLGGTGEFDVPVFERFFTGGSTSVRGYDYHLVGPLDAEGDPLGGLSWAEAAAELRFPIWDPVGGVVFVDAGDIERRPAHWGRDVFPGAGAGLRIATPVGPLRFDVAFPLDDGARIDRYEIHFSVGHAF
ncbi:MAG: BamA/TamA family outer membrane protein, partial [Myxococcales bacterium]|nr:BamA/TamA family outer membrane protein [Myxococcales bacterium]